MSQERNLKVPEGLYTNKGICTDSACFNEKCSDTTNSDSGSWRTPSKLKQEVQTIIDIMGPPLKPFSTFNTSSEADNEESIFSNSKVSTTAQQFKACECNADFSEKTDDPTISKDETNMSVVSIAADNNTSRISDLEALPCDQRCHYPMMDPSYPPQYICPPPLLPANICINSECLCPQMASMLHTVGMQTSPMSFHAMPAPQQNIGGIPEEKKRVSRMDIQEQYSNYDDIPNIKPKKCQRGSVLNWLKSKLESLQQNNFKYVANENNNNKDYYQMNIKRSRRNDKSPPRRVVFELVPSGIPKGPPCDTCALKSESKCSQKFYINPKNRKSEIVYDEQELQKTPGKEDDFEVLEQINACQSNKDCCASINMKDVKKSVGRTTYIDPTGNTRVDVYYFDHGNSTHFKTTDSPPIVTTEALSEKTERTATKFWAEIFGSGHIGVSFCTSFVLQLFRFLLYSILRPLTIGILQLASDYLIKPLLATTFNGVIQPILIFVYNMATSVRDLLDPLAEGVGYFIKELAVLVGAFRIFQKVESCSSELDCKCDRRKVSKKCSKATNC